jgi:hypothetical protein
MSLPEGSNPEVSVTISVLKMDFTTLNNNRLALKLSVSRS